MPSTKERICEFTHHERQDGRPAHHVFAVVACDRVDAVRTHLIQKHTQARRQHTDPSKQSAFYNQHTAIKRTRSSAFSGASATLEGSTALTDVRWIAPSSCSSVLFLK